MHENPAVKLSYPTVGHLIFTCGWGSGSLDHGFVEKYAASMELGISSQTRQLEKEADNVS